MTSSDITIYPARKIVTMNPSNPEATHVAVRGGWVLGVGPLHDLTGWGAYTLDDTFARFVLVPGMIEVHSHSAEGGVPRFPYQGFFDRPGLNGTTLAGVRSVAEMLAQLKALDAAMADPDEPLITQGFDPIYFAGERLNRTHLDTVSLARPVFVFHANGHVATVNSAMLRQHGITRDTTVEGVARGADGEPNGELQEAPAMMLASSGLMPLFRSMSEEETIRNFGAMARNAGITTVGDLGGSILIDASALARWQRVVNDPAFPARVTVYNLPALPGSTADWHAAAQRANELRATAQSAKLRFPGVKFVIDGSIQGWTAALNPPGYFTGEDHGVLLTDPEHFKDWLLPFHRLGLNIQVHCNGDRAVDVFLDAVEALLREAPRPDHRHTVQHSQLTTAAQYRRMAELGLCANIFANHLWYWGDQHYERTVGPERANRMEACATAKREGVRFSIHSDANVTPLGHLHTMWCAVNRITPSGRVLGPEEKISAYDALNAVTVDAAYQMHLDAELGSIEPGKRADFTVLEKSPLDVDPMEIRHIPVWGTVLGGVPHKAAGRV